MDKITLGVLGLGSQTTSFYIEELNRMYNEQKGNYTTCPFILLNTDFNDINMLLPNPSEQLDKITQQYLEAIEKLDVEYVLVPNITLHETIDRLVTQKKIIHPISLAVSNIKQHQWTKIVLFGSLHTMQASYVHIHLQSNGIETTLPSQEDMIFIDEVRKQVYAGTATQELIHNYHLLIKKYTTTHPVLLACTELSIFKPHQVKNLLDMVQIQLTEAVRITL